MQEKQLIQYTRNLSAKVYLELSELLSTAAPRLSEESKLIHDRYMSNQLPDNILATKEWLTEIKNIGNSNKLPAKVAYLSRLALSLFELLLNEAGDHLTWSSLPAVSETVHGWIELSRISNS